jgi:hypothetical protein
VSFRSLKSIDIESFISDVISLPLLQSPSNDLTTLLQQYNVGLTSVLNKHAPMCTKSFQLRPTLPWYDDQVRNLHATARRAERTWRLRKKTAFSDADWAIVKLIYEWYCDCNEDYYMALKNQRKKYVSQIVIDCGYDQKKLFRVIDNLSGRNLVPLLPEHSSNAELADRSLDFFSDKVAAIGTVSSFFLLFLFVSY